MRYRVRFKPHGCKRVKNGGWLYISTKAAKHLGVKPGDHLEIIFGANHFSRFLIIVPAGEEE